MFAAINVHVYMPTVKPLMFAAINVHVYMPTVKPLMFAAINVHVYMPTVKPLMFAAINVHVFTRRTISLPLKFAFYEEYIGGRVEHFTTVNVC